MLSVPSYCITRSYDKRCSFLQVGELKMQLTSVLAQWGHHKAALDEINNHIMEARYSLSRFRLLTGSSEAVQVQVDNLQVIKGLLHLNVVFH